MILLLVLGTAGNMFRLTFTGRKCMKNIITISKKNPSYWEINGKLTMLIDGSIEDKHHCLYH